MYERRPDQPRRDGLHFIPFMLRHWPAVFILMTITQTRQIALHGLLYWYVISICYTVLGMIACAVTIHGFLTFWLDAPCSIICLRRTAFPALCYVSMIPGTIYKSKTQFSILDIDWSLYIKLHSYATDQPKGERFTD